MSEHLEESVGEAMIEKINEAIHRKQPNNEDDSSSSSSDSETNDPSFSSRVYRLFGRQKPVHTVLGGGKRPLIHVAFGENEQPVGPNSSKFCTDIGRAVRTHISPTHNRWPDVPRTDIDRLWEDITAMYDVSVSHRSWVVKKANTIWRDWKHTLRHKFYDKYLTDAERKRNVPSHVKPKDWERFVDMCSTPAAQESRGKGKRVRDALKSPHTSGRKGQARVAEELKSQNPTQELSRTHLYIATHTKKDGSSSEQIALIRKLLEADPSSALMDIDNDPVSVVMGRDSRGCVRGLGLGVSRTSLTISAPYRDSLADSQATYVSLTSKVEDLSHCLETMSEKIDRMSSMLERRGACVHPPTDVEGSSEATLSVPPPAQPSQKAACRLMHLQRGSTCVAEGRVLCVSSQDEALFSVIIDEVFVHDCILIDREGTFVDIEIGETITWPRFRTVLV